MNFKFFTYDEGIIFFNEAKDYIVDYFGKHGVVAKLIFNDGNYREFLKLLKFDNVIDDSSAFITVIGEDGYFYEISFEKGIVKKDKANIKDKNIIKRVIKYLKKLMSLKKYKQDMYKKYLPGKINKTGNGVFGYDRYVWFEYKKESIIPFRLKKAKNINRPLVIYFSGGGCVGHDNFKNLAEFITLGNTYKLTKADCNILIPQTVPIPSNTSENKAREQFVDLCVNLINLISEYCDVDKRRIYIFGCSLGGGIVWNMLVNNSEMIAGAIEIMGTYCGYKDFMEIDFEKVSKTPIWMAHSSNDSCVSIESDDRFYFELTKYNDKIKYTRPDKYGHKLAGHFLQKERWVEWLLSQKRNIN